MRKSSRSQSHRWANSEFGQISLPDRRLNKRAIKILGDFLCKPTKNIPEATDDWAHAKAAYRFFDNDRFTAQDLLKPHQERTAERIAAEPVALIVQDTTGLNFDHHPYTEGLGFVGSGKKGAMGLWLHSSMAFSKMGLPLGVIDAKTWVRDPKNFGKAAKRRKLPIKDKESFRWLESFMATLGLAQKYPKTQFINIADREGDIFELFQLAAEHPEVGVLIRANHVRKDLEGKTVIELLQSQSSAGTIEVEVPRKPGKASRKAVLTIKFVGFSLKAPKGKKSEGPILLWAIEAQELNPPAGEAKGLYLRLFTNIPVTSFEQAVEMVGFYTKRWGIEEYHRILKSGCMVEDRQLETVERLVKALMLDIVVAYRVLALNRIARGPEDIRATEYFDQDELRVLKECFPKQYREELTVKDAVRMIAQLGGFLARKGDGEPGTMTLWRGMENLEQMVLGFRMGKVVGNA